MRATLIGIILELKYEVRNFKEEIPGKKYKWSCEVCGDSATDHRKARFGVKLDGESGVVNCFNCGYSNNLNSYLKHFHPNQYEKLSIEKLREQAPSLFDINSIIKQDISPQALKVMITPAIIGRYKEQLTAGSLSKLEEVYRTA